MKAITGALLALAWSRGQAASTASRLQFPIPNQFFKSTGYAHQEALFGIPRYGGSIAERLIYGGDSQKAWTLCSNDEADEFMEQSQDEPFILMIDRGKCTFASKVRRAQHLGASGVLIADNTCLCSDETRGDCTLGTEECEQVEPIMADDGSGADIAIPSFLMKKADADDIKHKLSTGVLFQAEMTWSLPAPDDRVEWSLWTSAVDTASTPFKRDFRQVVTTMGKSAKFTPYYVIYNGESYGCVGNDKCTTLCTNGGRYCMTDPDLDTSKGISGRDVVVESLRQKCIWNLYGGDQAPDADQGIGDKWWAYVDIFSTTCSMMDEKFNDSSCVSSAMKAAGVDRSKVEKCISEAGGVNEDRENTVLEEELREKSIKTIVIVPTVYVNNVAERGGISSAAVLTTICAGFKPGTEPEVCRCAGQSSSELVDACINNRNPGDGSGGAGGGGMSMGSTLFLLMAVVGIMTAAGFVYYRRTQDHMRDQVRGILAEYMPLEDIDAPGSSARVPFMGQQQDNTRFKFAGGRVKESQLV